MHIPDLPPDIRFQRLFTDDDLVFSYEAKRAALGPYVIEKWGWDETYQAAVHKSYFDQRPFYKIVWKNTSIGTVSLMRENGIVHFNEFYLLPDFQNKGIGTRVLTHCLALADAEHAPVRLQHLKWNPVGRLYSRHGFVVSGETATHYRMERSLT